MRFGPRSPRIPLRETVAECLLILPQKHHMFTYLAVGLLFILLVVFAVMARRHWHWSNIVAVILTFLAGAAAMFGAGKVLNVRYTEMKDAEVAETRADKAKLDLDFVRFGDPNSFTYGPGSLRDTENKLSRELIGQGRVWKHGSVEQRDGSYVFKFAQARQQMTEADKLKGVMLYVFSDNQSEGLPPYPAIFLGNFRVKEETPDSLTLAPEFVVSDEALSRPANWTLFEKMPIDRDSVFRDANGYIKPEPGMLNELRAKLVNEIMPASLFQLSPDGREYEEVIDKVLFDGLSLGDIDNYIRENQATRKSMRFEPSKEEVYVRFRFDDKSRNSYVVDGTGTLDLNGDFSPTGQAYNQALHYGKEISFIKGEEILVDQNTADGYQRVDQTPVPPFGQAEPVTEVGRLYKRKLADFPLQLRAYRREVSDLTKRVEETKVQNQTTQVALEATQTQERNRDELISLLQQDRDNLRSDVDQISNLLQKRNSELETLKTQLDELLKQMDSMKQKVGASPAGSGSPGKVAGR